LLASLGPGAYDLGRDPACHIFIDGSLVSWRHARLSVDADDVATLIDLGSRNGTRVNGKKLVPQVATRLASGDEVDVGAHALTIEKVQGGAAAGTPGTLRVEKDEAGAKVDVRSCPSCGTMLAVTEPACPNCGLRMPITLRRPGVAKQTIELGPVPVGGVVAMLSSNQVLVDSLRPAIGSNQGILFGGGQALFDALRLIFPRRPDLLLIDQHLPVPAREELDSWRKTLPGVRIGIFGDLSDEDGATLMQQLGADLYFRQPGTTILFVAKVRLLLSRARIDSGAVPTTPSEPTDPGQS
jgi:hypothetical protein